MKVTEYDNEIRYIREDKFRSMVEPFGYKVEGFTFEAGRKVYVKGPGLPFLFNGVAEDCDDWTAAGDALAQMIDLGLVPEVVVDRLLN